MGAAKLEIEFTSGVWTDVTAYTQMPVTLGFGVENWDDDGTPGTITATLENYDGRFTPDNPTSPYWPNIVEGIRCRWTINHASTDYPRGRFYIKSWVLNVADRSTFSTVTITGSDKLGGLSRRTMDSDLVERYRYTTAGNTPNATWMNAWPMITSGRPRRPASVGYPERQAATVLDPANGRGGAAYVDPTPLSVEGAVELTPNTNLGPVLLLPTQATPSNPTRSFVMWFKLTTNSEAPIDDFAVLLAGWSASNQCVFRIAVSNTGAGSGQQLEVHWNIDPISGVASGVTIDAAPNDGAWHSIYIQDYTPGVNAAIFYDSGTGGANASLYSFLLTDVTNFVVGGYVSPASQRVLKPRSVPMTAAGLMCSDGIANNLEKYARGDALAAANTRFLSDYRNWGGFTGAYTGQTGARNVILTSSIGRSITDAVQELSRTVSGLTWVRYADDTVELIDGTSMRPTAVTLTLTVGADDDLDPGQVWRRGAIENPTRQTVTSPAGDGTYINTDAELKERRDGSDVGAATASAADSRALAAWYVRRGNRLRLAQFGVDVTTAVQDLWAFVLQQLKPGVRIRVAGLDPVQIGYTYRDVHVIGWDETWDELETDAGVFEQSCRVVFNTVPADTPAELVFDDFVYGRFDFDLVSATGSALTASGTSLTITSTGPALTPDSDDYPLYLNLDGEVVQVTGPPSSTTSPQTMTIVRGQLGSVARAHATGYYVQVYPQAGFGA